MVDPKVVSPFTYDPDDAMEPHDCDDEAWDVAWHTNNDGNRTAVHWCAVCGEQMSYRVADV